MATILIGADICPIGRNRPLFIEGDADALFNDLLQEFQSADLSVANLECPLIEHPSPIVKTGPTFGEPTACINGIREAGLSIINLANNHIMDHGEAGLRSTLQTCNQAGIATVGAGKNLEAARRILFREAGGIRIAILSMAEHEFSIAAETSWGANPLDLVDFVRSVEKCRDQFDYLIVLIHGGHEFCPYPSPRIKKTCRFMVEMGADFVAVQHAHCLGGYESYRDGHIVYGQGALVMDEDIYRDLDTFHEGYLVKLTVEPRQRAKMDIIPFRQSGEECGARRMLGQEAERFMDSLARKAELIQDDAFLQDRWMEFCESQRLSCLSAVLGHGRVLRKLNTATGGRLAKLLYGRRSILSLHNVVRCETHREILDSLLSRDNRRN